MNGRLVMECIDAAYAAVSAHSAEILALDQQIGDGDHVLNLLRGLEALRAMRAEIEAEDAAGALKRAAGKVLSTVGGSSGPLFSSLLLGMARTVPAGGDGLAGSARMFAAGVDAVRDRGRTGTGSKTMMDVLIPVAERFRALAEAGTSRQDILRELPAEAERGMRSTRDMLATKGRASFLGERSIGHIDPGARSSQVMISAVCGHMVAAEAGRSGT
jgi:dihydroxyacetone kinase-like protein